MSCQQATRITEDPYTFTEPPVISSTNHYSSHISSNKKGIIKPQQSQNNHSQFVQNRPTVTTTVTQAQKLTRIVSPNLIIQPHNRVNGQATTTTPNGLQRAQNPKVTTIYGSKPQINKQFLPPPAPLLSKQHKFLHQVTIKANSGQQTTTNKYLKTINSKQPHHQQLNVSTSPHHVVHQVQQQQQQQFSNKIISINSRKPIINHSNNVSSVLSTPTTVAYSLQSQNVPQQQQPQQPKIRAIQYYNGPAKTIPPKLATPATTTTTTIIKPPAIKKPKQDLPTLGTVTTKNERRMFFVDNQLQQQQFSNDTDWEIGIDTSSKTFIIPKVQTKSSRAVSPSDHAATAMDVAKKGKGGKLVASKKTKRSHSNASYHETLQRIPTVGGGGKKRAASSLSMSSSTSAPLISIISASKYATKSNEWHAPSTYIFDYKGPGHSSRFVESLELAANHQEYWFNDSLKDIVPPEQLLFQEQQHPNGPSTSNTTARAAHHQYPMILTRDQRLEIKKSSLRRQAVQYWNGQRLRSTQASKHRLRCVDNALNKLTTKEESSQQKHTKCTIPSCSNASLAMATYCFMHIINNKDQRLFQLCTAKFSDNSQCRVPVFDISHGEKPLCREHAWKRDNYIRIIQEQKPKKPPRKKSKPSAMTRPSKKNRKKKKALAKQVIQVRTIPPQQQPQQPTSKLQPPQIIQKIISNTPTTTTTVMPTSTNLNNFHSGFSNFVSRTSNINVQPNAINNSLATEQQHPSNPIQQVSNSQPAPIMKYNTMTTTTSHHAKQVQQKEYLNMCENSSAYESSEDTGVGGLSETEFISGHDIIEEIPFEIEHQDGTFIEEHELTNVLNHIEISEIFSDQNSTYEPTQEEQADLELALEAVDEQLKRMQHADSTTDFLGEFLANVDDLCEEVTTTSNSGLIT